MQLPTNRPRPRIPLPAKRSKMQFGKGGCALNLCRILLLQLHSGEAEAIALATDLKRTSCLLTNRKDASLPQRLALPSLAFWAFCCAPGARATLQRLRLRLIFSARKPASLYLHYSKQRFSSQPESKNTRELKELCPEKASAKNGDTYY